MNKTQLVLAAVQGCTASASNEPKRAASAAQLLASDKSHKTDRADAEPSSSSAHCQALVHHASRTQPVPIRTCEKSSVVVRPIQRQHSPPQIHMGLKSIHC